MLEKLFLYDSKLQTTFFIHWNKNFTFIIKGLNKITLNEIQEKKAAKNRKKGYILQFLLEKDFKMFLLLFNFHFIVQNFDLR
jgi:hypothetical protein